MKLTKTIKPMLVKARTKSELMHVITNFHRLVYTVGRFGNGLMAISQNQQHFVRVYNLEKHRPKFKTIPNKKRKQLVKPSRWDAYIYDIPTVTLESFGLKVEQKTRNFVLVKNKG